MEKEKKQGLPEKAERIFLVTFGFLLIVTACVCMKKPLHNLIPLRMAVYTLVWLGLLWLGRSVLAALDRKLSRLGGKKLFRILLWVFMAIWAVLLYGAGCAARSAPHTDYGAVYGAADALARGLEPDNWDYFSRWTNNRFPMVFLSVLLRAGYLLGMKDGYYFALAFQVLHVMLTAGCVYYLAGRRDAPDSAVNAWTAMMLMVLLTPIWGNIAFFYTDQLSFGWSIIAYTLVYVGMRADMGRHRRLLAVISGGLIWGIACQIKVTVVIPLIAAGIVFLIRRMYRKRIRWVLLFGICLLTAAAAGVGIVRTLPCEENVERDSEPVLYWVALGLNGDGSYADNQDFARQIRQAENVEERRRLAAERIKNDWRNFFSPEHLTEKARRNFACGDLGASGYMAYPYREGNFIYETISWDGKWFWKYACLSTSYLFALFFLAAAGAVRGGVKAGSDSVVLCSYVAFFGIMLFLMLWEAQNKQLFNHSGWMILAAGYGLQWTGRRREKAGGGRQHGLRSTGVPPSAAE